MTVADILQQMAETAGNARRSQGSILGNTIENLSNLPGQIANEHERQQWIQDQRRRQQAQDQRQAANDRRQTTQDAQQAKKDAEAERQAEIAHQITTVYYAGSPNDPSTNDLPGAEAKAKELGVPELIPQLRQRHRQELLDAQPKLTEFDPTHGSQDAAGNVVRQPVAKVMTPAEQAQRDETVRHNKETERLTGLTTGRAEAAQKETERHNRATEATAAKAADPFGLNAPANGAAATAAQGLTRAALTGEDFLKTLPPALQLEVKAHAEGRRPFPTGMSYAKLQPMIQLVGQYDPTFDAANYNARNKARTDLTSPNGTGAKTIGALNTAIQHAGKLSDLIEKLDNYESPMANAVVNPVRTAFGSTKVTNYDTVAPQLAKEIERVWRGAGGTAGEIHDLIETIGHNKGKQQQREALQQFVDLAKGKLDTQEQQRDTVLGPAGKAIPILYDSNKAIVEKIAQRAGGKPAAAAGAPTEGQEGIVKGVPAVWKTVNGVAGWYAQ